MRGTVYELLVVEELLDVVSSALFNLCQYVLTELYLGYVFTAVMVYSLPSKVNLLYALVLQKESFNQ